MADEFCLKMPDFHVTFRDNLHAVDLHETDGFTSLPKEGVLRIFSPWKIRRLRPGLNPRTWVPNASTLPLDHRSRLFWRYMSCDTMEYITHALQCTFFLQEMNIVLAENSSIIVRFRCHSMNVHSVSQHKMTLSSARFHYCSSEGKKLPLYTPRRHIGPAEV